MPTMELRQRSWKSLTNIQRRNVDKEKKDVPADTDNDYDHDYNLDNYHDYSKPAEDRPKSALQSKEELTTTESRHPKEITVQCLRGQHKPMKGASLDTEEEY